MNSAQTTSSVLTIIARLSGAFLRGTAVGAVGLFILAMASAEITVPLSDIVHLFHEPLALQTALLVGLLNVVLVGFTQLKKIGPTARKSGAGQQQHR